MKYPLVIVEWEDATNIATWMDEEEALNFEEHLDADYNCLNVGYLLRSDDECVIVAARSTQDFKAFGLVERIPRGMVKKVRILKR